MWSPLHALFGLEDTQDRLPPPEARKELLQRGLYESLNCRTWARIKGRVDAAIRVFDAMAYLNLEDTFVFYVCIIRANLQGPSKGGGLDSVPQKNVRFRDRICPLADRAPYTARIRALWISHLKEIGPAFKRLE